MHEPPDQHPAVVLLLTYGNVDEADSETSSSKVSALDGLKSRSDRDLFRFVIVVRSSRASGGQPVNMYGLKWCSGRPKPDLEIRLIVDCSVDVDLDPQWDTLT